MGCDIHLIIEQRKKVTPYINSQHGWFGILV